MGSSTLSSTAVRRQQNKKKIKSLEWTDEAIEAVSNQEMHQGIKVSGLENQVVENTMESKIARVNMRKEEAAQREIRKLALPTPPPRPESVLTHFSSECANEGKIGDVDASHRMHKLTSALNIYFRDYLAEHPYLLTMQEANFPLQHYDDSSFDERLLSLAADALPAYGAVLLATPGPETSPAERGLGEWHACKVVAVQRDAESGLINYAVEISSLVLEETQSVGSMQVCLCDSHDAEVYSARIEQALKRRHQCIALWKYSLIIENMPVNKLVTSSMTDEQFERIYRRAASTERLMALDTTIAEVEIEQAKHEFETAMNKVLFNANLLSIANTAFLHSLRLPESAMAKFTPVPQQGLVHLPAHNMKAKLHFHRSSSYLNSAAAISSLQQVLRENKEVFGTKMVRIDYNRPFTLEKFDRYLNEQMVAAVRRVKQEWPQRTGVAIKECIARLQEHPEAIEGIVFDIGLRNVYEFDRSSNAIKPFLERVNFMMSDVLFHIMRQSLEEYSSLVRQFCSCEVTVEDVRNIRVHVPEDSIYKRRVLPPLFSVAFRIATEDQVLNAEEMQKYEADVAAWKLTKEAEAGEKCPVPVVKPIMGKTFVYSHSTDEFKNVVMRMFPHMVSEFLDVPHVRKFVLDHVYFPQPRFISSVTGELPWVHQLQDSAAEAMDAALKPLNTYLKFFKKYENFVNVDNTAYIASKIQVHLKDPDSTEIEVPVSVNLEQVRGLIDEHLAQIVEIEASLPITPIECGLFLVEVVSVRQLLLEKHRQIIKQILGAHADRSAQVVQYLEEEFKKINRNLARRPENIEQLVELEEYVAGLGATMNTLQHCIEDMMSSFHVLDRYKFKTEFDVGTQMWGVYGAPAKVMIKCEEVAESNISIKRRFREEMLGEQATFSNTMRELVEQVGSLAELVDLHDVEAIAAQVTEVENRIATAQAQARLFNSREGLFESDVTDYEELGRIQKNFEPYANLWQTTKEWLQLSEEWMAGKFIDLDANTVEANVDRFSIAINKAAKFFGKAALEQQSAIANKIKAQIQDFVPEVPMIVTLRNPGMRDRHWEQIAAQLKVDIIPIENFTTEQIISLNLKDSLELIQKIGESAAKEYQIEQALDKMEREWDEMMLNLHPYRETGTAVLKGVDDINVVLDEQITMTQTIMFSAFKGPFEERIEEWNRKLCCISDVLEVWVTVQRNWLYLQPIFESPDINRQLPTEGKKFSTVDKSWRQTIAAAKQKPKVIDFCDSAKLLERFKESDILLDQVQKGLSDYLETKRSVFARFYFLSNDELLSILSESKDVKLVQPHLKKCFEGIDKVQFLGDLTIDRLISPENEELMLTAKVDPNEKNVEHWMLELEKMMRISVNDVMGRAIANYTEIPRTKWMQKWPGMCVLNGSQMHWTREMEELFISEGGDGPATMLQRQVSQLADMTILVRGQLSKAARVTVGALTVIDVHARDVIKKLADERVESKDNFGWTSQLRYYWDGSDLTAQMVAATRPYGYEYLGNTFRLVITPLTDKCYLTLMGALQMIFGGAPAGPAGTGKTETTKGTPHLLYFIYQFYLFLICFQSCKHNFQNQFDSFDCFFCNF